MSDDRAMRIRQIALVARALEPAVAELGDALGLEVCHRDPGVGVFGLENAVMAIGDTFLEVVSPKQAGTTAGRLLERRGGDGGYMILFETDDLARERARVEASGVRVVWEIELEAISAIHLHPRDIGGTIVSIDRPVPAGSWLWAGPGWQGNRDAATGDAIVGAELAAHEPELMAARWSQVLGLDAPHVMEDNSYRLDLPHGELRFAPIRDERGEGLTAFDVRTAVRAASAASTSSDRRSSDPPPSRGTRSRSVLADAPRDETARVVREVEICGTRIRWV